MHATKDRFVTKDIVLEARKLVKQVSSPEGPLTIVDDVDFQVTAEEATGQKMFDLFLD
jgi:predicted ABC-type transport system involved in lysophospholipase L1 biosynthesis ATPase subunit